MFTTLVHSQSAGQILAYKTFYFLSPHGQSVSRELKNAMTGESIAKERRWHLWICRRQQLWVRSIFAPLCSLTYPHIHSHI